MRKRLQAAAWHLAISCAVAILAAAIVYQLWYPAPYDELSGGRTLFVLIVAVDVALGPLITLAVFNTSKPKTELRRDLTIVGLLQLAGLAYGLHTVFVARPVHLVFEFDRFRVVHAVEVAPEAVPNVPPGIVALPLNGPTLLGLRAFASAEEQLEMTMAALGGVALSARPELWRAYGEVRSDVLARARPLEQLMQRYPQHRPLIEQAAARVDRSVADLLYLPLVARHGDWVVLVDSGSAQPVAYVPVDAF